jgi:intein/homing endonuclease
MYKCIDTGGWDFGVKTAEIIPVSSRGLTANDSSSFFTKRAGTHQFKEVLDNMKLAAGEVPIHLIALGALEDFSCNRNGDGFDRQTLKDRHHTFVKNAHVYRHHENKDPKKSYGKVAASLYNDDMHRVELLVTLNGSKEAAEKNGGLVAPDEDIKLAMEGKELPWSMGCRIAADECLVEGTLISTENGYKPIEQLEVGEKVWSHTGNLRSVNHLYSNYSDHVGTLHISGSPLLQGITGNHPIYAIKRSAFSCAGSANGATIRHTKFKGIKCGRCSHDIDVEPQWIDANEIQSGDFIVALVDQFSGRRYYAGDFGYMLGMYLGDGCITYSRKRGERKGCKLNLKNKKKEENVGGIAIACDARRPTIIEKIKSVCKTISDGKVKCYSEGNGRDGRKKQGIALNLTDRELALRLLKFGGQYCRSKRLHSEVFKWSKEEKLDLLAGMVDSDGSVDAERGSVRICTLNLGLLLDLQRVCFSLQLPASVGINNNGQINETWNPAGETSYRLSLPMSIARRITTSVKINEWLKANENFNPSTSGKPSSIFFYKNYALLTVAKDWTPIETEKGMQRVYNFRVQRDESYIANGVIVHNCSACGNKAKTPSDYCEEHECIDKKGVQRFGCKHGLTKTAEDGFVQYVGNPNCTFIDISRVSTPADRNAYGAIAKYASDGVIGGATLALLRGYVDEEERIVKVASLQVYSDMLTKLANLESTFKPSMPALTESLGFRLTDNLPEKVAKHAASLTEKEKCAELMHLADFDIILGPKQFAKYAGIKTTPAYVSAVSGLFGQLDRAHDNRLALLDSCSKYACTKNKSLPPYYSFYPTSNFYTKEGESNRCVEGAFGNVDTTKVATTPEPTAEDYRAAVDYSLYKLAALTRMNNDVNCVTAIIQNFV